MSFKRKDLGIVPIGKYRGKKWSQVPTNHLKYIIKDTSYLDPKFKQIARYELSQRDICEGQLELFENIH